MCSENDNGSVLCNVDFFSCRSSYVIASPENTIRKKGKFVDIAETADIHASVINAMIYVSGLEMLCVELFLLLYFCYTF